MSDVIEEEVRAFDPAGFTLVHALLRRADALSGVASEILRRRAETRLAALTDAFAELRARRTDATDATDARLAASLERRKIATARAARRAAAAAGYERACADFSAAVDVARVLDTVPEAAGPYNALSLAARALGELGAISPGYLRAQVMRLEELGALLHLPPAAPTPRARLQRKRS